MLKVPKVLLNTPTAKTATTDNGFKSKRRAVPQNERDCWHYRKVSLLCESTGSAGLTDQL